MNILLIVIDTLRADHLGCYGYARDTSPNIDAFAREAVLFERMIAPAIPTHPAFSTLLTGQYPITHGVVAHGGKNHVRKDAPWLPTLLQRAGYTTCAVDNLAEWSTSFRRGFEYYVDPTQKQVLGLYCGNREINARAIPWIEQHRDETFFMMIHYWDPHTPYLPPRAYRTLYYKGDPCDPANTSLEGMEKHPLGKLWRETWFNKLGGYVTDAEYIAALYDGEIRYCDEGVGDVLRALQACGLDEKTIVVIMGDHGEMMYRHGVFFDHHGLYDGNLHVPLIVRCPGEAAKRVPHVATHVDVAPTLLRLAGVDVSPAMEGCDVSPSIRGESDGPVREYVVSCECTWQMKWSIRTEEYKFILAREKDFYGTAMRELYDLRTDSDELHNIAAEQPGLAAELERILEEWIADKMKQNGLAEDPLVAHGISLGKQWKAERSLLAADERG